MYYIEENDKPTKIEKVFKIIKMEDNKIILPLDSENQKVNYQKKLAQKVYKLLEKTNSNKILLSREINNLKYFVNILYSLNMEIVDGQWIKKIMALDIVDYIIDKKELKKQELEISVLVNDVSEIEIEHIKELAKDFKRVNIVTNHIEKFKNIEQEIYNEMGIVITINNNKKKSLTNSQIILNYDFPNELINKYNILDNAIIINIRENIKIYKKRFEGIVINDFEINKCENEKYDSKQLYESKFFKKQSFKYIRRKINEDEIKVAEIIGNNGKIIF